jgi:hypothetical protein
LHEILERSSVNAVSFRAKENGGWIAPAAVKLNSDGAEA